MFNASVIPPVYHPTRVMLIDDNENFLMSLSLGLDEDIPCLTESDPLKAMEVLEQASCRPVSYDLKKLLASPDRFDVISVVVVDKSMPAIDGLDFCVKLDHDKIKAILLTGVADIDPALHAMEVGVIDAYINKGELSALPKLNQVIKEFSAQQLSVYYSEHLLALGPQAKLLQQVEFIRIFQALCKQYAIVEFYLLDEGLQFLCLDQQATAYLLSFHETSDIAPKCSSLLLALDGLSAPESLAGTDYDYSWTPVKSQIPICSFMSYMRGI